MRRQPDDKTTRKTKSEASRKSFYFEQIKSAQVPHDRTGKHRTIVFEILHDLSNVRSDEAVKIARGKLGRQKLANVRAALNRAARKAKIRLATSSDERYLYVWLK